MGQVFKSGVKRGLSDTLRERLYLSHLTTMSRVDVYLPNLFSLEANSVRLSLDADSSWPPRRRSIMTPLRRK